MERVRCSSVGYIELQEVKRGLETGEVPPPPDVLAAQSARFK